MVATAAIEFRAGMAGMALGPHIKQETIIVDDPDGNGRHEFTFHIEDTPAGPGPPSDEFLNEGEIIVRARARRAPSRPRNGRQSPVRKARPTPAAACRSRGRPLASARAQA